VAGPVAMVRETIRVLARAGIPQQRIHYDDALLADDQRASLRRASGETGKTCDTSKTDARDEAETAQQDANVQDGGTRSGTEGEPAEREQVSASVLAGRHDVPPG
jgi:hypothetical protein